MKVEVNRNDEMPKAGDLVIDELGNIGILMHNGYIWLLKHMTYEDEPIKFEICLK